MACVVCDSTKNVIICPNGHAAQCGRCMLNRIQSIYNEGRSAFNDDDAQKCFTCRCEFSDEHITKYCPPYNKMLELVVIKGQSMLCLMERGIPSEQAKKIANDPKQIKIALTTLNACDKKREKKAKRKKRRASRNRRR